MGACCKTTFRFSAFERIVSAWNAFAERWKPIALIIGACALLTGPLIFFRGYNSDEGLAVSIARTALEDGEWLVPHVFNLRWVERPTLLSWIIGAMSAPFGRVNQVTARVPIVLFLFFGCMLIYLTLRKQDASLPAALFGVALFLASPLVLRSNVLITADLPLAVLLFFAFYLWWGGNELRSTGVGRWLAIGIVLTLAGLLKGPQPVAYFALGVGIYVLASRSYQQIPGLILAGLICALPLAAWYAAIYAPGDEQIWGTFMRVHPAILFSSPLGALARTLREMLPAVLAAAAFLVARGVGGTGVTDRVRPGFVVALACYAFTAAILVWFWPGGSTPRYYFPMLPPLCVFGGLGYDLHAVRRPQIVALLIVLTAVLLVYGMVYSIVSPFLPSRYRQAWLDAERITTALHGAPGPIYRTGDAALNILPYVDARILIVPREKLATISGPA